MQHRALHCNNQHTLKSLSCAHLGEDYRRQIKFDQVGVDLKADLLIANGKTFLDKKQYGEALFRFREAVQLRPYCVKALLYEGITLHHQHKFEEATSKFRQAKGIESGNTDALYYYGIMLFGQRYYTEAQEVFNELLTRDPKNLTAKELLKMIQNNRNNNNSSSEIIETDQDFSNYAIVNFVKGKILLDNNDLKNAISMLEKASKTSPQYSAFHQSLGRALCLRSDLNTVKSKPKRPFTSLGQALKQFNQNKDLEKAVGAFKQASNLHPENKDIYLDWGKALVKQKKFRAAIRLFQKAQTAEGYRMSGQTLISKKKYRKAILELEKSNQFEPNNCETYILWGSALYEQKIIDEAITKFKKAAQIDPKNADAQKKLEEAKLEKFRAVSEIGRRTSRVSSSSTVKRLLESLSGKSKSQNSKLADSRLFSSSELSQ